jgi:hypothetical protein
MFPFGAFADRIRICLSHRIQKQRGKHLGEIVPRLQTHQSS